ncbi:hypothetical protein Q8A67_024635 [Cirrhinus molitorella]|uniref:Uncharacterized protein n=1 Tax=Cirrhinus molitorella TaxID=172907 RepID=A0AA88TC22_9TELE|nr:hypothetical protein Q8A67_024635 [Cirrhinus molitorella]
MKLWSALSTAIAEFESSLRSQTIFALEQTDQTPSGVQESLGQRKSGLPCPRRCTRLYQGFQWQDLSGLSVTQRAQSPGEATETRWSFFGRVILLEFENMESHSNDGFYWLGALSTRLALSNETALEYFTLVNM